MNPNNKAIILFLFGLILILSSTIFLLSINGNGNIEIFEAIGIIGMFTSFYGMLKMMFNQRSTE